MSLQAVLASHAHADGDSCCLQALRHTPQCSCICQMTLPAASNKEHHGSMIVRTHRGVDTNILRMFIRATGGDLELSAKRLVCKFNCSIPLRYVVSMYQVC